MRTIKRREPAARAALAALAASLSLVMPATPAAPATAAAATHGGTGEIRVTELRTAEGAFYPREVNLRGQVLGLTVPDLSVSLFDRSPRYPRTPSAPTSWH